MNSQGKGFVTDRYVVMPGVQARVVKVWVIKTNALVFP